MLTARDRRRQPRVGLTSEGCIELANSRGGAQAKTVEFKTVNVSRGGLALLSGREFSPNSLVHLRFRLGQDHAGWLELDARVVRSEPCDETTVLSALEFLDPDLGSRVRLRDFVSRTLRAPSGPGPAAALVEGPRC